MNNEKKPKCWYDIVDYLPIQHLDLINRENYKDRDFAIVKLSDVIQETLDKYKFYIVNCKGQFKDLHKPSNSCIEIISDLKMEIFIRDCVKKYYIDILEYNVGTFFQEVYDTFKLHVKIYKD